MQTGDVLQIVDVQQLVGFPKPLLNVFYYRVETLTGTILLEDVATDFANSWGDNITSLIVPFQAGTCKHVGLRVNNLMDYTLDFFDYTYPSAISGTAGGDWSSPALALSIQLIRSHRTTRNGSKRIGGISDAIVDNNTLAPSMLDEMSALTGALGEATFLDLGGVGTLGLDPVILKSPVLVGTVPTVINPVSGARYRGVGTQASRKKLLS